MSANVTVTPALRMHWQNCSTWTPNLRSVSPPPSHIELSCAMAEDRMMGIGVAMPKGVTALCTNPDKVSESSSATSRRLYCFFPSAAAPSSLRTTSVSLWHASLAPAY
eukprot:CAMPEP_0119404086 /NCGR_PEP_ID=MMETSP1334-20130426/143715_1 /TAXON_ID=127549 /ORGANISM="Calcidiscus leptoporus, Strain RCC1130" /LENGTH=107 /DNA_ID=CAMNT_0007428043 /DNA_START=652 /DNA_END=975 /DNA_ORIENTATION=-